MPAADIGLRARLRALERAGPSLTRARSLLEMSDAEIDAALDRLYAKQGRVRPAVETDEDIDREIDRLQRKRLGLGGEDAAEVVLPEADES